jgi:hypothetical protein
MAKHTHPHYTFNCNKDNKELVMLKVSRKRSSIIDRNFLDESKRAVLKWYISAWSTIYTWHVSLMILPWKEKSFGMSLRKIRIVCNQIQTFVFTALNQPDISDTNE